MAGEYAHILLGVPTNTPCLAGCPRGPRVRQSCMPLRRSSSIHTYWLQIGAVYCLGLTNIITDLLLMSIPIRIIIRSKLAMKTKLELAAVFALGIFVVIASMLRMIIVLTHWTQQNKLLWGQIECFTATIVANAPVLHGLWRHGFSHIRRLKFGKTDECPPEYSVAVRQPTPAHDSIEMSGQLPRPPSRRDRARQSVSEA